MVHSSRSQAAAILNDAPLDFNHDQESNLTPQLRRVNMRLGLQSLRDFLADPSAILLLGGAAGALVKRKYALASFLAAGLVLQQALSVRNNPAQRRLKDRKEMEFERYALKAQRGDYGKLEVIAFK